MGRNIFKSKECLTVSTLNIYVCISINVRVLGLIQGVAGSSHTLAVDEKLADADIHGILRQNTENIFIYNRNKSNKFCVTARACLRLITDQDHTARFSRNFLYFRW